MNKIPYENITIITCTKRKYKLKATYLSGIRMLAKFEIYRDGDFWCARGIRDDIFTQGRTMDELFRNLDEAVELHNSS